MTNLIAFTVTETWLREHSGSVTTSWSYEQRAAIGCAGRGPWIKDAIGKQITLEQKAEFERLGRERRARLSSTDKAPPAARGIDQ